MFPVKTNIVSGRDQIEPWRNRSIKNNILKRHNNYKLYQQDLISEREYKHFCSFVNKQNRIANKNYYEKTSNENKNKLKKTWIVINKVLSRNKTRSRLEIKPIMNDKGNMQIVSKFSNC